MGPTFIGLKYGVGKETSAQILGFVDSDYVGYLDTRRSLTGYNFQGLWKYSQLESQFALGGSVINNKNRVHCYNWGGEESYMAAGIGGITWYWIGACEHVL